MPVGLPDFDGGPWPGRQIPIGHVGYQVKHLAVGCRPQQGQIFGVGPYQRHGGAGRLAAPHALLGAVGRVPHLFAEQPAVSEPFECADVGLDVAARGQLVVGPLAGEQRPRAPAPPAQVRPAIVALAVAVMVIAAPNGSRRRFDPQAVIDDPQRILDQWIAGLADAITHQFEKTGVDDFAWPEKRTVPPVHDS